MNERLNKKEWLYTLPKNIIDQAFNQPRNAIDASVGNCCIRGSSIDWFLIWQNTKEGFDYWQSMSNKLRAGDI